MHFLFEMTIQSDAWVVFINSDCFLFYMAYSHKCYNSVVHLTNVSGMWISMCNKKI